MIEKYHMVHIPVTSTGAARTCSFWLLHKCIWISCKVRLLCSLQLDSILFGVGTVFTSTLRVAENTFLKAFAIELEALSFYAFA
jgi:hypothetical protein